MNRAPTHTNIRQLLLAALKNESPRGELDAWTSTLDGGAPLYLAATNYCAHRRHELSARLSGFDKSGESVVATVAILKKRAADQGLIRSDPEIYQVPETSAIVYLWRTSEGSKPFVVERAPSVPPDPVPGMEHVPVESYPPNLWYQPDHWRQVRVTPVDEHGGMFHLDLAGGYKTWEVPSRTFVDEVPSLTFDEKLATPCFVCDAESVIECGHKTMAEELGGSLPEPEGPCAECKKPLCREKGGAVCRSPGCPENPGAAKETFVPSPCPICKRRMCDHTPAERGQTLKEVMEGFWCSVCEGADPESSDVPNGGHHPRCELGPEALAKDMDQEKGDPQSEATPPPAQSEPGDPGPPLMWWCDRCLGWVTDSTHSHASGYGVSGAGVTAEEAAEIDAERAAESMPDPMRDPSAYEDMIARDTEGCACGHARASHSRPDDECSLCACVQFRAGPVVELESKQDRANYEEKKRRDYVLSLDMTKVTKQRSAKEYAQCKLCRKMIGGNVKNASGKITTPGDEWVGPPAKTDKHGKKKTPSMRHRSHLACADEALLKLKESASASTQS